MIELKELWGEIRTDNDLELLTGKRISANIRSKSKTIIAKLHHKLNVNIWLCVIMSILLASTIPLLPVVMVQVLLTVVFLSYVIAAILIIQEFRMLKRHPEIDTNLLSYLQDHSLSIKAILKYESLIAMLLYPISAIAGFLLGMYLFDPKTNFLNDPLDWGILLVALGVFIPVSHFINRWFNNRSFGRHLTELDAHIEELQRGN